MHHLPIVDQGAHVAAARRQWVDLRVMLRQEQQALNVFLLVLCVRIHLWNGHTRLGYLAQGRLV